MTEFRFSEQYPYYVYVHYRNDNGQPFYVGMGKKNHKRIGTPSEYQRAFVVTMRSDYWTSLYKKHGRTVEIFMDHLTKEEAQEKEVELIKLYGRKEFGGILCNLTDGGDHNGNKIISEEQLAKMRATARSIDEIMFEQVMPCPITGCWNWTGPLDNNGKVPRPVVCYKAQGISAHRLLYRYFKKLELRKNDFLSRACRNEYCVNPDHMILENSLAFKKRMVEEGRVSRGGDRPNSKLSKDDVLDIRRLLAAGVDPKMIGRVYGVLYKTILAIRRKANWAWLK